MLIILLTLVTAATYTWFSLSQTPRVSDMNMFVNVDAGLRLSLDPTAEEWKLQLDLREMIPVTTPLRPVTWVQEENCFYAAAYGIDGRLLPFEFWEPLSDEFNANKDTIDGYYIKLNFYARSDTDIKVSLAEALEVDEGINGSGTYLFGRPIWDPDTLSHKNGGFGAETAMRIGLRITPVDNMGDPNGEESTFFIYEPNADVHLDHSVGFVDTPSVTGAQNLVGEEYLIRQGLSLWNEHDPVERDVVVKVFGDFDKNPTLFSLKEDEMVRIDIYIWMEGQDKDCINEIRDAQILANLQFHTEMDNQSGLVPIDPDE
jgi:hypothetical protein